MRLSLLLPFLLSFSLVAQLPTTPAFDSVAAVLDLRINHPFDAEYKVRPNPENDYLADDLTVYSKPEKLEIRLKVLPETERDVYFRRPHLRASMLVLNLASNDEDAVTTLHSFDEEELAVLNADWARMWTFRPKRGYSPRATAQLVAAYKTGRGMFYTILLFDKPPGVLEGRQLLLRFR